MSVCETKAFVNISEWWVKDKDGNPASVNSVFERFKGTPNEVNRYTLTRALYGKLRNGDFDNLLKLARICSELSGKQLTINDLVKEEGDRS